MARHEFQRRNGLDIGGSFMQERVDGKPASSMAVGAEKLEVPQKVHGWKKLKKAKSETLRI